jgi:curved DNA-binding protein CbpA
MPEVSTFEVWAESLATMTYYQILRVRRDATGSQIKEAFHSQALRCHPDNYASESAQVAAAAAQVFKRVVDAYAILSRPLLREKYDLQLVETGKLTMDPNAAYIPKPKPKPAMRTLEMVARTRDAKQFALKADRFLTAGNLEAARLALVNACQRDPNNQELAERLTLIYEAMALE